MGRRQAWEPGADAEGFNSDRRMKMSIFPTGGGMNGRYAAVTDRDPRLETDGVLDRPIRGQIYVIEDEDLAALPEGIRSRLSGLISRH